MNEALIVLINNGVTLEAEKLTRDSSYYESVMTVAHRTQLVDVMISLSDALLCGAESEEDDESLIPCYRAICTTIALGAIQPGGIEIFDRQYEFVNNQLVIKALNETKHV